MCSRHEAEDERVGVESENRWLAVTRELRRKVHLKKVHLREKDCALRSRNWNNKWEEEMVLFLQHSGVQECSRRGKQSLRSRRRRSRSSDLAQEMLRDGAARASRSWRPGGPCSSFWCSRPPLTRKLHWATRKLAIITDVWRSRR